MICMPSKKGKKLGLSVIKVKTKGEGLSLAKEVIYKVADKKTLLFLSGGTTPKPLYELLSKEKKLKVGAVALVDERYGEVNHPDSNEKMIADTGFVYYLKSQKIPFYPILRRKSLYSHPKGVASEYQETVRELLSNFSQCVAILGIGLDGHTAGIAPNRPDFKNPLFEKSAQEFLVLGFCDPKGIAEGGFGPRITLTFNALSKIDLLLILAFGENKKGALLRMFKKGSIEEIPARFYLKPSIAKKTLLITDQKV